MFGRLRRRMGNILGNILYWVGCALAVVVLVQAVILSVTTGGPLIPVLLGTIGVTVWLIGIGFKYLFVRR